MALRMQVIFLLLSILFHIKASAQHEQQQQPLHNEATRRPNILFILTDDQDLHMDSLSYMPHLKHHLIDRGLSFNHHYCTVALCCPSRVSMWTGKAAHNTNVTDINPPYGGYPKFVAEGFNDNYLPIWLQAAGYSTYYVGKLFNAQTVENYASPHAAGWTGSDFLLDPYTYRYLNATFQRDHEGPRSYEGAYVTDVVAEKAQGFLEDALEREGEGVPFFLTVAPTAPHSDVLIRKRDRLDGGFTEHSNVQSPPIPAERHKHLFQDVVVPRTPNFNPEEPKGVLWISRLPKQNETNVEFNDHFYRSRLRALQAVDEMIDALVKRLEEAGVMGNTFIFYSTDNGYTIGQHRRQPGKQCAFEQDINVPFIVRGPGVPEGVATDLVTSHTDVAPTFLSLANTSPPSDFELDGQAIPLTTEELRLATPGLSEKESSSERTSSSTWRQEHVNVEMWGIIMSEGKYGSVLYPNHTYKALRVIGEGYSFLYTVWCSGEHELYDMMSDPYQLHNLIEKSGSDAMSSNYSTPLPEPMYSSQTNPPAFDKDPQPPPTLPNLLNRLDALLMVLKTCIGHQCTHPWETLFPGDGHQHVRNLAEALDPAYDRFFETGIERVEFGKCELGYFLGSEGPVWQDGWVYGMGDEVAAG